MPRTLLHIFPTFDVGGSQMRMTQLANHFGDRYRHLVMPLDGRGRAAELFEPRVPVTMLDPLPRQARWRERRRRLAELAPDLMLTYNWGSMDWVLANLPRMVPHLHVEDGFGPDEIHRQKRRRVLTRFLALRRSRVVFPSETLLDIARDVWRLPAERMTLVPNGIDPGLYPAEPHPVIARLLPPDPANPVIGTVAALRREKRLDRLLHAFALLRERRPARLAVVGEGAEAEGLKALAAKLGIAGDVVFTGRLTEPQRIMAGFDLMAMSSDHEQMPYSLLEAMAAGLAVVATDVGDIRRMVSAENLSFVKPCSHRDLAAAMAVLLDHPGLRRQLGAANRRRVCERYDQAAMFACWERLFDGRGDQLAALPPSPDLVKEQTSP